MIFESIYFLQNDKKPTSILGSISAYFGQFFILQKYTQFRKIEGFSLPNLKKNCRRCVVISTLETFEIRVMHWSKRLNFPNLFRARRCSPCKIDKLRLKKELHLLIHLSIGKMATSIHHYFKFWASCQTWATWCQLEKLDLLLFKLPFWQINFPVDDARFSTQFLFLVTN